MAGRHARKAPVLISRAVAMLVGSILLLAVGVAAMTILTDGERPGRAGPEAGAPTVVTGPPTSPTVTTATSNAGAADVSTRDAEPSGDTSFGVGFDGTTRLGPQDAGLSIPSGVGAVSVQLADVRPGAAGSTTGWVQRSDAGRAHGKAVGLLRRAATHHGCRPNPTKARPNAAKAEPAGCR